MAVEGTRLQRLIERHDRCLPEDPSRYPDQRDPFAVQGLHRPADNVLLMVSGSMMFYNKSYSNAVGIAVPTRYAGLGKALAKIVDHGKSAFGSASCCRWQNRLHLERDRPAAPRGGTWSASTISGNRRHGTGILNNELYIGCLGRRLSHANTAAL